MRLRIKLDDATLERAEAEAKARHEVSRAAGVVDRQIGKQSSVVTDLVGLLGEIAFARIFGYDRDDTVSARSGTADFVADNGDLIEVKSSYHDNPHLLVPAYLIDGKWTTKEPIAVYVLMRVEYQDKAVTFMGWTTREGFIDEEHLGFFRGTDRRSFIMPPDDLLDLDEVTAGVLAWTAKAQGHDVEAS